MKIIKSTFTDPRDNRVYKTIKIPDIGREFFAENLDFDLRSGLNNFVLDVFNLDPGCWCYDDNENLRSSNGLLYSFEAAPKACPKGWTIPKRRDFTQVLWTEMTQKIPHERKRIDYQRIFDCSTRELGKGGFGLNFTPSGEYSSDITNLYKRETFKFKGLNNYGIYWTNESGTFDNGGSAFMFDYKERMVSEAVLYGGYSVRPIRII